MQSKGLLADLIHSLCCLPGVGPKSAQRMAFHLLQHDRASAIRLSEMLALASKNIGYCKQCRTLTEDELCRVCQDDQRNCEQLCIVETPADAWVIDKAGGYKGRYFILHGRLSPLDGIGPDELNIDVLEARLQGGGITEVILATNSTVEGEATAHFIAELAQKYSISATRIAHGVPMGGELEYIDSGTLIHAFDGRRKLNDD